MASILEKAAETIQRLGSAAQDCKSCARLPECNAYQTENRFENCDYKWVHEDEAAGVQPVKRGKWELTNNPNFRKCSVCGLCQWAYVTNYCQNCGADMRDVPDTDAGEIANTIEFKKRMKEKSDEQTN